MLIVTFRATSTIISTFISDEKQNNLNFQRIFAQFYIFTNVIKDICSPRY